MKTLLITLRHVLVVCALTCPFLVSPPIALADAPSNDSIGNATPISQFPFSADIDLAAATVEDGEPFACAQPTGNVWYRFTPAVAATLRVSLAAPDTQVWGGIYKDDGSGSDRLSAVNSCVYSGSSFAFPATEGETYYVSVNRGLYAATLTARLDVRIVSPPSNDNFNNATPITSLPFDNTVDTLMATVEPSEPELCLPSGSGKTVWYSYTASSSGSVTATVSPSAGSAGIAVYVGPALTDLTQLACQYGVPLTLHVGAGSTYYFQTELENQGGGLLPFALDISPSPVARFEFFPYDPSSFDAVQFVNQSFDPAQVAFTEEAWTFGDGSVGTGTFPQHRYAADGDYTTTLRVTSTDGRAAETSQVVQVRTHDVAITKFETPNVARSGQTRSVNLVVKGDRYEEPVTVTLYKVVQTGGTIEIGSLLKSVPARGSTKYSFSYRFSDADRDATKVSFMAVANISFLRDARPADNTAFSFSTRVE